MAEKDVVLKVENLSKLYRLGTVGTGTIGGDVQRFWKTKILRQEDPFLKVGTVNDRTSKEKSDFVWALKDINFEVKQGEVLGIIGKNGAGKSTLLKLLSRITSPTTGSVKIAGRMASLLEVGTGFHPELTGRENIFLNGAILGMTKREIQSKFDEIVDFSGCDLYIDTPTKRYSSGMTVRLGFAVAAFLDPEILVVDEVLAVGDAEFQKKAIGKMNEISKGEGRTVLFVSHNMGSIKSLCSRAIVMDNGYIIFNENVDQAISKYLEKNTNKVVETDLKRRLDRVGNGRLIFTKVDFLDSFGNQIDSCISYNSLVVSICYETYEEIDSNDLIIGLNFQDEFGTTILAYLSDEMGVRFNDIKRNGVFFLKFENLPLRSQTYQVRLLAFKGNTKDDSVYDIIENAATLMVLPGDAYGVGMQNRPGHMAITNSIFTN